MLFHFHHYVLSDNNTMFLEMIEICGNITKVIRKVDVDM